MAAAGARSGSGGGGAGFAKVADDALRDVREQWTQALADAVPEGSGESEGAADADSMFSPYKSSKAEDAAKAAVASAAAAAGDVSWAGGLFTHHLTVERLNASYVCMFFFSFFLSVNIFSSVFDPQHRQCLTVYSTCKTYLRLKSSE